MGDTFTIDGATVVRETDKAILVDAPDLGDETWVPKSVVDDDSEIWDAASGRRPGQLVVKRWWAEKQGWI